MVIVRFLESTIKILYFSFFFPVKITQRLPPSMMLRFLHCSFLLRFLLANIYKLNDELVELAGNESRQANNMKGQTYERSMGFAPVKPIFALTFCGGLDRITGGAHKGPFTGQSHKGLYEILTTSWHAQLSLNLAMLGSLTIVVAHHMYAMPPYPYLATDYDT
ncbi:Photosystem I PsaA/PsaB [Cynara cardunculus var. scolymus]|uniref:Photosystem I PsaA/PsaB n=1 Tax=Cynara cardunculus var. scolymus TaxID=59895 RepID=A0A118K2J5_CYNCS|nr:Photosystem I PsaA/PsaB [Cynara cardunculus var. scolymus]